jgi:hypothetical protein
MQGNNVKKLDKCQQNLPTSLMTASCFSCFDSVFRVGVTGWQIVVVS